MTVRRRVGQWRSATCPHELLRATNGFQIHFYTQPESDGTYLLCTHSWLPIYVGTSNPPPKNDPVHAASRTQRPIITTTDTSIPALRLHATAKLCVGLSKHAVLMALRSSATLLNSQLPTRIFLPSPRSSSSHRQVICRRELLFRHLLWALQPLSGSAREVKFLGTFGTLFGR